jgi:hypothetical protein
MDTDYDALSAIVVVSLPLADESAMSSASSAKPVHSIQSFEISKKVSQIATDEAIANEKKRRAIVDNEDTVAEDILALLDDETNDDDDDDDSDDAFANIKARTLHPTIKETAPTNHDNVDRKSPLSNRSD